MFDINSTELVILIVVAVVVIGPERLPEYLRQLRRLIRQGRDLALQGKEALKREVGPDVDLRQYDPRQYDPRRIVRDALAEEDEPSPAPRPRVSSGPEPGATAPFDPDAT
ncbi:twin-arginine translocase TatA/TatE family subunit [Demequina sp. NBRC 110052]|uniref:twin-arginine translocase TatA/TatE family subunit n=1 Tax=Demequina sp. NBRC 110052 TaxID=1570341 RepID=UPI0009FC4CBC|nr:twin-arginine translocase TatA/TatE family subunit [Demequina sp. NBRC 110052]